MSNAAPPGRLRILGLHPHPSQSGQVVITEDGLVPDSVRRHNTRRLSTAKARLALLERMLRRAIWRHEPQVIAIAADGRRQHRSFTNRVIDMARRFDVPLAIYAERALARAFHRPGLHDYDRLGQVIGSTFFPQLTSGVRSWKGTQEGTRRWTRPVWKAAAAALVTLATMHPAAASALVLEEPAPPVFADLCDR